MLGVGVGVGHSVGAGPADQELAELRAENKPYPRKICLSGSDTWHVPGSCGLVPSMHCGCRQVDNLLRWLRRQLENHPELFRLCSENRLLREHLVGKLRCLLLMSSREHGEQVVSEGDSRPTQGIVPPGRPKEPGMLLRVGRCRTWTFTKSVRATPRRFQKVWWCLQKRPCIKERSTCYGRHTG